MADPIDLLTADAIPPPKLGTIAQAGADVALSNWLAATATLNPLVTLTRSTIDQGQAAAGGLASYLGLAFTDRARLALGGVLDSLGSLLTGPGPGITYGFGAPTHPGYGGDVTPATQLASDVQGYVTQLVQLVLNDLFGAPIV